MAICTVHLRSSVPIPLLAVILACLPVAPVTGQSSSDLRQENERLRSELSDLRLKHDAVHARITALESALDECQRTVDTMSRAPGVTPDPSVPAPETRALNSMEHPVGLLTVLRELFASTFPESVTGEPSPERVPGQRVLRQWREKMHRSHRFQVDWLVAVEPGLLSDGRHAAVRVRAIDPRDSLPLGDSFPVILRPETLRLLQKNVQDHHDETIYRVRGTLVLTLRLDPESWTEFPFQFPALIGPGVEFLFQVEAQNMVVHKDGSPDSEQPIPVQGEAPPNSGKEDNED